MGLPPGRPGLTQRPGPDGRGAATRAGANCRPDPLHRPNGTDTAARPGNTPTRGPDYLIAPPDGRTGTDGSPAGSGEPLATLPATPPAPPGPGPVHGDVQNRRAARDFLQKRLLGGPAAAIFAEARALGISATLKRAKADLGVRSTRTAEGWLWSLP